MAKVDDSTFIMKVRRKIQFAGQAGVAVVALPSLLKQVNNLKKGDLVEVVYDMRKPDECKLVFRKTVDGEKNVKQD
jgi:hypothetical protein